MPLIPVLVRLGLWDRVRWLRRLQILPRDDQSLSEDSVGRIDSELTAIAGEIAKQLDRRRIPTFVRGTLPAERCDITRLPITGAELFGRSAELDQLDAAWDEEERLLRPSSRAPRCARGSFCLWRDRLGHQVVHEC